MLWAVALVTVIWAGYAVFGRRWQIAPRLAAAEAVVARVAAVVPARNEARELPHTLPFLFRQAHADLTIILVDDHSEDGTAEVARRLAADAGADARLLVIGSPELPSGWTGKVWAQHQGVERALGADWIWLTDADIRHDAGVLQRLLATAQRADRDFVSVMARLRCSTAFEKLLIPAFTYFFAGLAPSRRRRRRVERPEVRRAGEIGPRALNAGGKFASKWCSMPPERRRHTT